MLYFKKNLIYASIPMVEAGILLETGAIPFPSLTFYSSTIELTSGLCFIYSFLFTPFILLFSIFFAYAAIRGKMDTKVLYSLVVVSYIPISLNTAGWILSGYTGTGGGLLLITLLFFLGWALIWIGGIVSPKFGFIPLILGTIMTWSPYGIGIILFALAYMLRMQEYSKKFYTALFVMLMGFFIAIYGIINAPTLK